jgi:hypothetical protein
MIDRLIPADHAGYVAGALHLQLFQRFDRIEACVRRRITSEERQYGFRWSRGSDPRLLRLTMDGLLDRTFGERPLASRLVNVPRLDLPGISGRGEGVPFLWMNYGN